MNRLFELIMAAFLFLAVDGFSACSVDDPAREEHSVSATSPSGGDDGQDNESDNVSDDNDNDDMEQRVRITVGGREFTATLADNGAARAFASMLPLTLEMSELNGNEKYYYFDTCLPTESYTPDMIMSGDLMLYGSSCVVLFYKTFRSDYSYTRLGRIDNPDGLATAVGAGDITVRFENL